MNVGDRVRTLTDSPFNDQEGVVKRTRRFSAWTWVQLDRYPDGVLVRFRAKELKRL